MIDIIYREEIWLNIYKQFANSNTCSPLAALKNNAFFLWLEHERSNEKRRLFFYYLFNPANVITFNYEQVRRAVLWYMRLQILKSRKEAN